MICPPETTVQLKPATKTRGYMLQSQAKQMKYVYSIVSMALTVAGVVSTYYGYVVFLPILTTTWVLSMVATMSGPRLTMKHMVLILNGYIVSHADCTLVG